MAASGSPASGSTADVSVQLQALAEFVDQVRLLRSVVENSRTNDLGLARALDLHALPPADAPSPATASMRSALLRLADDYQARLGTDAGLQTLVRQLDVTAAVADLIRSRYEKAMSLEAVSVAEVSTMFDQAAGLAAPTGTASGFAPSVVTP